MSELTDGFFWTQGYHLGQCRIEKFRHGGLFWKRSILVMFLTDVFFCRMIRDQLLKGDFSHNMKLLQVRLSSGLRLNTIRSHHYLFTNLRSVSENSFKVPSCSD